MDEITIPALGRLTSLGDLWNAQSQPLNPVESCWTDPTFIDKHTVTQDRKSTDVSFNDIQTYQERTTSLSLSATFTLHICFVPLSGSGGYVDSSKSTISTRETSITCTATSYLRRLTAKNGDLSLERMKTVQAVGATHLVSQIIYGGKFVASFTSNQSTYSSNSDKSGIWPIGDVLKVAANAIESFTNSSAIEHANSLDVRHTIYSDLPYEKPATVSDALKLLSEFPKRIYEKAIPCLITLTPISRFVTTSPLLIAAIKEIHILQSDQVDALFKLLDQVVTLYGRTQELDQAIKGRVKMFPTLAAGSSEETTNMGIFLGRSRDRLNTFVTTFQNDGEVESGSVERFVGDVYKELATHQALFDQHEKQNKTINTLLKTAEDHGAHFIGFSDLPAKVTLAAGPLCVILIPVNCSYTAFVNIYRSRLNYIRTRVATKYEYCSVYLDNATAKQMDQLNDGSGNFTKAVTAALQTQLPSVLFFQDIIGVSGSVAGKGWSIMNQQGFGVITNPDEPSVYVGSVRDQLPDGKGNIEFADHSTYDGSWWQGQRHGKGTPPEGGGVYIEDVRAEDGFLVELRVYNEKGLMISSQSIPLRQSDPISAHVEMITKMARWGPDRGYKLTVMSTSSPPEFSPQTVQVKGFTIMDTGLLQPWSLKSASLRADLS